MESTRTVLLLGGTGKVGRHIAKSLAGTSIPTFQASRKGESTTEPDAVNIKPVAFDWGNEDTWSSALKTNPDSVYLVAPPVTDMVPPMQAFIDLARANGAKRFVLLSASSLEGTADGFAMGRVHWYLKQLGDRGEVEWAALRPTWFQQNFVEQEGHVKSIRDEDAVYSATADGKIPWVSAADIAACAFHLLTQVPAPNGDFLILGPELLSYQDIANILTDVLGRTIVHRNLSPQALEERFKSHGMPEDYAKMMSSMDTAIKNGSENRTSDAVLRVTGKPPSRFRELAEKNKHAWTTSN